MSFSRGLAARVAALCVVLLPLLALAPSPAAAQSGAAGGWKVFQELSPLLGSWSGTADSGGRIGGRVATAEMSVDGALFVYRANTVWPAAGGRPEERSQEAVFVTYDGDKGKYVALAVFSTKVWGTYDVELKPEGVVRLTSREFVNYETGARSRIILSRKGETELVEQLEVAPSGKEFAPFLTSKLTKK